jgi:hypothetical protein
MRSLRKMPGFSTFEKTVSVLREVERKTRPKPSLAPVRAMSETAWLQLMAVLGMIAGIVYSVATLP